MFIYRETLHKYMLKIKWLSVLNQLDTLGWHPVALPNYVQDQSP